MSCRAAPLLLLPLAAACSGDGSDIGPKLAPVPAAQCVAQVLDDQGRGVAGALVTLGGQTAATNREGRAFVFANPVGRQIVAVDGSAAAASDGNRLGSFAFVATLPAGELPFVVHLPDAAPSSGLLLTAGTQATTQVLDDSGSSGAQLAVLAGSSVGSGTAATVTVRTGVLASGHLPGELPLASAGAQLFGRAVFVDPPSVTFTPAAPLSLPNDLAVPAGSSAVLYFLDPTTGIWTPVNGGLAAGGGALLQVAAAVAQGGLYAFGIQVTATASINGRVVDAGGQAVPQALVRAGEATTRCANDGTFQVDGLAASLADGTARQVSVEVRGGRLFWPIGGQTTAALTPAGTTALGDLALATVPVGNLRLLMVQEGRAAALRRCAVSSLDGLVAFVGLGDDQGQCVVEDLPTRWFGFADGQPLDAVRLFEAQVIGFMPDGQQWFDFGHFLARTFWNPGSRVTRALALDWRGGGPIRGAAVISGVVPDAGFVDLTREGGAVVVGRPFGGAATIAVRTSSDGRTVTSAFTFVHPNAEHLECPLQRADRKAIGAFDRHGLVRGTLLDADPTQSHRVRSTRRLEPSDWFDDVFLGVPIASALPVDLDPATGGTDFAVGTAAPKGHLAAVEGSVTGGVFTLAKVGLGLHTAVAEGNAAALDLDLAHAATAVFMAPAALTGLDPALPIANLTFDLALLLPDGTAADVVRAVGGNHAASGTDVGFTLPPLTATLAGHTWLVAFGGSASSGGATIAQRTLTGVTATSVATAPFLPVPDLSAPLPGATVASSGFNVSYTVPPGTRYMMLDLRADDPVDALAWQVVLPPTQTAFDFVHLPSPAPTPLQAGRTYLLTVSAFAAAAFPNGPSDDPYRDISNYWMSIDAFERGVVAVATRTITVTAN